MEHDGLTCAFGKRAADLAAEAGLHTAVFTPGIGFKGRPLGKKISLLAGAGFELGGIC